MLSANWITKVITVPLSDLTLESGTRYFILVADYAQLLRELNGSTQGVLHTVLSPIYRNTLATSGTPQIIDVINGYTVQFEVGVYSVEFTEGNTNFRDIEIKNNVSVGVNNVSGFNTVSTGSGLDAGQDARLTRIHSLLDVIENGLDHAEVSRLILSSATGKVSGAEEGSTIVRFRDNADTKDRIIATVDGEGNRIAVSLDEL